MAGPRALVTDSTALPFAEAAWTWWCCRTRWSCSADPHATLREVQRVLVPEGRVVICGLNPASLWGLRQRRAACTSAWALAGCTCPTRAIFIGYWRLRDWLRLLQLRARIVAVSAATARPAQRAMAGALAAGWTAGASAGGRSLARPTVVAVKRVRGMRLLGPAGRRPLTATAPVPLANKARPQKTGMTFERVEIYTDGACKGNPGPGGWGVLLRSGDTKRSCLAASR
jgi:hypothetical protein